MGWFDSLFKSSPQALTGLFARSTRKSPALTDSELLKRGEEEFATGRRLLSSLFRKENPKRAAIMSAIGEIHPAEIQPAVADEGSGQVSFLAPAALAVGGTLSLAWSCALALCTYDLVCWLFA